MPGRPDQASTADWAGLVTARKKGKESVRTWPLPPRKLGAGNQAPMSMGRKRPSLPSWEKLGELSSSDCFEHQHEGLREMREALLQGQ